MKKKEVKDAVLAAGQIPATRVTIAVDVTKIVKYLSLAGVAIVGIIFGTKYMISANLLKDKEDE